MRRRLGWLAGGMLLSVRLWAAGPVARVEGPSAPVLQAQPQAVALPEVPTQAAAQAPSSIDALGAAAGAELARLQGQPQNGASPVAAALAGQPGQDFLYDGLGAMPSESEVLSRAQARGVTLPEIGEAIQGKTPLQELPEARRRLVGLGLLAPGDYRGPAASGLRTLLEGLWFRAAPRTPRLIPLDRSWPVPALKVERDGVTYYVHGLVHSASLNMPALRPAPVGALLREVKARNGAMVSELNFPAMFGYSDGVEVMDRGPGDTVRPAFKDVTQAATRWFWTAVKTAAVAAPAALAIAAPGQPLSWAALAGGIGAAYLIQCSFAPLRRAGYLWSALAAPLRKQGIQPAWRYWRRGGARQAWRWASAVYRRRLDADALRRVQLPLAPSAYSSAAGVRSRRAQALAAAALVQARRTGAREVHVLTGFQHAEETAARLSEGLDQRPRH